MDKIDLILGRPLKISNMTIRHPKVYEVCEYGEDVYDSTVGIFTNKPSDMMVALDDIGINYMSINSFQLFVILCDGISISHGKKYDQELEGMLGWLTGIPDFRMYGENGEEYLYSEKTGAKIDKAIYFSIRKYLSQMNFVSDSEKYNPGNEVTVKAIIREERRRAERQKRKEKKSRLASNISSLVWASGKSYEDIMSLYMYQLRDGIDRIDKIKRYEQIMSGYYSGSIDKKNLESMQEEIYWCS